MAHRLARRGVLLHQAFREKCHYMLDDSVLVRVEYAQSCRFSVQQISVKWVQRVVQGPDQLHLGLLNLLSGFDTCPCSGKFARRLNRQ